MDSTANMITLIRWKEEVLDRHDCPMCHTGLIRQVLTSQGKAMSCECGACIGRDFSETIQRPSSGI